MGAQRRSKAKDAKRKRLLLADAGMLAERKALKSYLENLSAVTEAEYRGWELTRVRLYTDGSRRVLLRRKKTRTDGAQLSDQPGP